MIKVLKTGFYTTIQDAGRFGYQDYGVPISGAMDDYAFKLANSILGNFENEAVLEMTMTGPTLEFMVDTLICITGANMSPEINSKPIKLNYATAIKAGDVLSFGKLHYGFRTYLAVKGGIQSQMVMNSRSFYKNITTAHTISKGEVLKINEVSAKNYSVNASVKIDEAHFKRSTLDVFKGPEFDQLSVRQQEILLSKEFRVSKNHSRMAYQLEGQLENRVDAIITSFVLPGTMQLTPSGTLIVLMRDCQTTGGYPRVLQLTESSINQLSQKQTNDLVKFRLTVL